MLGHAGQKKYKPLQIHDVKDLGICDIERAQKFEGKVTRKYMEQYGDNNVRGGDLTDVDEYVRRFGYFVTKEGWDDIKHIAVMTFLLVAMSGYILWSNYFGGKC